MGDTATPREVFARLSGGISGGDWAALHELYALDARVDILFAIPVPVHIRGRDEVRRHFAMNGRTGITLRATDVRVHETTDPEVIVAEYDYEGEGFRVSNIQVLRVRDGLIVETRDYHNHAALADALRPPT